MKEAAISYSPHAYVPKRTLTEEERVVLYRTRIDASFKPYTVIDVLQKVYHRSFEDDLLNAVTLHRNGFSRLWMAGSWRARGSEAFESFGRSPYSFRKRAIFRSISP